MNRFSIADIENMTGIKAHTLRIWEQRHNVCNAQRKDSGHRFYDETDLKHILRLALLYKCGYKISHLAGLREDELLVLASRLEPCCGQEDSVAQLMTATQALDPEQLDQQLDIYILRFGFERAVLELIFPFLEKIGLLWLTDRAIPAQEHMASNVIIRKIVKAIDGLDKPGEDAKRRILLFTPPGEIHEISLLLMAYHFRKNGGHIIYLGKEVPISAIKDYLSIRKVTHVYTHLITQLCEKSPVECMLTLKKMFPETEMVISGRTMGTACQDQHQQEIRWLADYADMLAFTLEKD